MAVELRATSCVVATGSSSSAPQTFDLTMPARTVRRVRVIVPPGPNGEVGFYIANSGLQIIPFTRGQWLIVDNQTLDFDLNGYVNSGSWQLVAYNTGFYSHALQVIFDVDPNQVATPAAGTPLVDNSDLSLTVGLADLGGGA